MDFNIQTNIVNSTNNINNNTNNNNNINNNSNNNNKSLELLEIFIEGKKFLNDSHIKNLVEKTITLGFQWDVIKEAFKDCIYQYMQQMKLPLAPPYLNTLDFKTFINEEKFIEKTLHMSIQAENISNNNNNHSNNNSSNNSLTHISNNSSVCQIKSSWSEQNSECENDSDDFSFYQFNSKLNNSNLNNPNEMFLLQQKQQMFQQQKQQQLAAVAAVNKPKQVSYQEFLTQSLSRLNDKSNLRPIIIDGNDVGTSTHSMNKQIFAFSRIKKVVDYFEKRQHQIYVLLPMWRKEQIMSNMIVNGNNNGNSNSGSSGNGSPSPSPSSAVSNVNQSQQQQQQQQQQQTGVNANSNPINLNSDQEALLELEDKGLIHFTPSKRVGSKHIKCDDDNAILQLAVAKNGIIVSNDNFKRYLNHSDDFKQVIEDRVLMYSFIDDTFMPAEDPLGIHF